MVLLGAIAFWVSTTASATTDVDQAADEKLLSAPEVAALNATTGRVQLDRFFQDLNSLRATFEQTVLSPEGEMMQQTSGSVEIARPMKFRWHYTAPYQQDIVTDGNKLWLYDHDLEQVTIRPLDKNFSGTPAALLSSKQPLDESFLITELDNRAGLAWVELRPRNDNTGFDSIRLGFTKDTLAIMELIDSFGQTSIIKFHKLQKNITIDPQRFKFVPPPDTDVIRDESG